MTSLPGTVTAPWWRFRQPSEQPWAHCAAWSGERLILLPCSWARLSCSEVPRYHRVLTMASAWERKWLYSDLGKKVVFLPSLLLHREFTSTGLPRMLEGVLLLADVSGFTALAHKCFIRNGPERGSEKLAEALNDYMGYILEEILAFGGDVLKFAGDAVLVLWRASGPELPVAINLALQCCRKIQKNYGSHDTYLGHKLHLRIGISAGILSFTSVRGGDRQFFFICNWTLDDVIEAQGLSANHQVMLSHTCWKMCEQQRIRARPLAGDRAMKVVGMRRLDHQEYIDAVLRLSESRGERRLEGTGLRRPSLVMSIDSEAEKWLEKHLSTAVLRKLSEGVPLELFSELRPVTSLFIQMKFADNITMLELSKTLSNSSKMISEIIMPHKGEINKTLLFDKGCTVLCVFGFSGAKLAYESTHALQCALRIFHKASTSLRNLRLVSAAVSSGMAFCGLTGHPERFEYTALGFRVNLAARMMMTFPGMVCCDAETCAASCLPSDCFQELPKKVMKGVGTLITVYQYLGITRKNRYDMSLAKEKSCYGPLLGREAEIDLFECHLEAYKYLGEPHILAFVGIQGSGKSHLLAELAALGQAAAHRVITVSLIEENVRQPFSAIRLLVARVLGLQASETCSDRQRTLQTLFQGTIEESSYCLLNDVFFVEFPITDEVHKMSCSELASAFHLTCTRVLEKVLGGEFGLFFIDNAHFLDPKSWCIMWPLLQSITVFMVMSLAPGHDRAEDIFKAATESKTSQRITCHHLEGLKASAVVQKACQELGVCSIPRELARFLIQRSSGIPYYCEELLCYLRCNNMLLLHTGMPEEGKDNWQSLMATASPSVTAASSSGTGSDSERICAIRPGVSLENPMLPVALKEIALVELDRIELKKQMVLKFAAIIGPVFTTHQLVHLLPTDVKHIMNLLLDMLVEDNILKRLKTTRKPEEMRGATEGLATSGQAGSGLERPSVSTEATQQQSDVLAFCAPLLWEATYELWPMKLRVSIHRKCAAFLERHAHKCQRCHGGDFVAFHRFGISSAQEQQSCQDSADKYDQCSWEALVLAGEHLRRARTYPAEGILAEGKQTTLQAEDGSKCSCQCEAIAEAVLAPLARHYMATGSTSQAFYYLLECAAAYLHVSNSYMVLTKLNEAEVLRSSIQKTGNVIDRFEEAVFASLKGEVCSNMRHVKLAKKMSRQALSLLKKQFPDTCAGASVKSLWEGLLHAFHARSRMSFLPQEARRKKQAWLLWRSRCLSLLKDLYNQEGTPRGQKFSRLAALMKANTDIKMRFYQAAESHVGQPFN
ncbi:adenylate cyclase type 10-like [Excalfactoria chinensis]|uniref:adenylate cyclase type 10-like n=1 Tax=Excalfactoria chinensis TaxID=46218 RepID=UPI003B3A6590